MKIANKRNANTTSIRTRLTLLYSLGIFFLLAFAAIFLYWSTITLLYKADYAFLADEAETIQYIMMNDSIDYHALNEAVIHTPQKHTDSIYRYYIRVYDAKTKILLETPGISNILKTNHYLTPNIRTADKQRYFWYSSNNDSYLLLQAPITIGKKNKPGLVVVALNISFQHDILHDRTTLVAGLLAGTLISLLLGFFITHRGLRSFHLLTHTVQKITANSLNQRIDPTSWPIELTDLGIAFNQMLDRIELSVVRLQQFSADLSHELRTPIANLIGHTEISLAYATKTDEYRKTMESNLEELQHISSLIENILFLSKAENPQADITKSTLQVANEIGLVCDFYQAMANEKNIRIIATGNATLNANPDMFKRMISNILSNAIKYTPNNGLIQLHTDDTSRHSVIITLKDNGIGIADKDLPKVFDRFFRVDAARSQSMTGTGLGLAITKSIIDIHHGHMIIQSELNKGTTITISLPKMTELSS